MKTKTNNDAENLLKSKKELARRNVGASILFSCVNAVLMIAGAWILSTIVAGCVFKGLLYKDFISEIWSLLAIYAARSLCQYLSDQCAFSGAAAVKGDIRQQILRGILNRGPVSMAGDHSGTLINSYVEGVEALHNYYAQILPSRITVAFVSLAIFFCISPFDYISSLILVVTAPLIPIFMIWIGKGAELLSQKQWQRLQYMSGYFLDRIQGLTTIKLFDAGIREARMVDQMCERFRLDTMAVLRVAFLSSLALEFFATVSIAMIAVMIGFRLMWGEMSFQPGFFILLLAPEFYLPLRKMGALHHAKMDAVAAAEKIVSWMPSVKSRQGDLIESIKTISFENVNFLYEEGPPVLKEVSFVVKKGEKVAITGSSGAGKSTIFLLLLGYIRPSGGRILINDIPLESLDMDVWRQRISWIPQKPYLFSGTVRSNILQGDLQISDARYQDIVQSCGLTDLQDIVTGRNGVALSGGQAQRVAVARAMARNSDFFLMDEATAHLDDVSESSLIDTLKNTTIGKTMIFSTHRSAPLSLADRIMFLEHGHLKECVREAA